MAFSTIVQDAADEAFGPSARVHLKLREPHVLSTQPRVWVAWAGDDSTAFAIGAGDTMDGAFRALLRSVYSTDRTLITEQVARVLCVRSQRVRQLVAAGSLAPVSAGSGPVSQRFNPTDVLRRAGLIRVSDATPDTTEPETAR